MTKYDSIRLSLPKDGDLVFYTMVKRVIDITGALLGILFFLPLFMLVALLIGAGRPERVGVLLSDPHWQRREALQNVQIPLDGIERGGEAEGPAEPERNSRRDVQDEGCICAITKVGRFIRKNEY